MSGFSVLVTCTKGVRVGLDEEDNLQISKTEGNSTCYFNLMPGTTKADIDSIIYALERMKIHVK